MQVGLIGLGAMGNAMANNLLKAGFALSVYNRSSANAKALAAEGASWATTPAKAAQVYVVITMLANGAAGRERRIRR
jgi:3-hydroxyisobutyrate dehydrogenase-like beta-hydroxyacid dehydrogenase